MFEALAEAAEAAQSDPAWEGYADYCRLREQGLRKESLRRLDAFITALAPSPFERRLPFVRWVLLEAERGDHPSNGMLLLPHPLVERLVVPTLREWEECEPQAAEPAFWLGHTLNSTEHYRRAITLDPSHAAARACLAHHLLGFAAYSTHELPSGYIGEPEEGLAALDEAEALVSGLPPSEERESLLREVAMERALTRSWMDYVEHHRRTGEEGFEWWAREHGRVHSPWSIGGQAGSPEEYS
jgi:hypothetical protein